MAAIQSVTDNEASGYSNTAALTPSFASFSTIQHTDYGLSRTRQTRNLKRDATKQNYTVEINDNDKNVNIQGNSGFFLEVASPLLLSLSQQTINPITIQNVSVLCSNTRESLNQANLHVNNVYFFLLNDLAHPGGPNTKVTVHSYITQHSLQLQGSGWIAGQRAPVWLTKNVVLDALKHGEAATHPAVTAINSKISQLSAASITCLSCKKKISMNDKLYSCTTCNTNYHKKCTNYKSSCVRSQPIGWKCSSCQSLRNVKRTRALDNTITSEEASMPPPKILALEPSTKSPPSAPSLAQVPDASPSISSPATSVPVGISPVLPTLPISSPLSNTSPLTTLFEAEPLVLNVDAQTFEPVSSIKTPAPESSLN